MKIPTGLETCSAVQSGTKMSLFHARCAMVLAGVFALALSREDGKNSFSKAMLAQVKRMKDGLIAVSVNSPLMIVAIARSSAMPSTLCGTTQTCAC